MSRFEAKCRDGECNEGTCKAAGCTDGAQSGSETDVDCGGGACAACAGGLARERPTDCVSGACGPRGCAEPICGDRVQNGNGPLNGNTAFTWNVQNCWNTASTALSLTRASAIDTAASGAVRLRAVCLEFVKRVVDA